MQKIGILGGGQLGRMLLQAAINYPVQTFVLESDENCPAAHLCHHFVKGDIKDFDAVYSFGQLVDVLTIEIENVNVDALEKLEAEGKRIYPKPAALRTLKNKVLQKKFYAQHGIPTSPFVITNSKDELRLNTNLLPAVHKSGEGGYDGKGVELLKTIEDLHRGFDDVAVLEKMIDIEREVSIIVAKNDQGQLAIYPPVDMVFDHRLNLLSHQLCPSTMPQGQFWRAEAMALKVVKELDSPGIFAVELFVDKKGDVWVNETAPRAHNSGHHSIEANFCSQFDMLWRIMLNFPLGSTKNKTGAAIVNLIGEARHSGPAHYQGLDKILAIENAFVHIYGKTITKPGRKMGHVTLVGDDLQDLLYKVNLVKNQLKVIAKEG